MKMNWRQGAKILITLVLFGIIVISDRLGGVYGRINSEVIFESIASDYGQILKECGEYCINIVRGL